MTIKEKLQKIKDLFSALLSKGKADERENFWYVFQGLAAKDYHYAFSYDRFSDENYNPQKAIICDGETPAEYLFYKATRITDTKVPVVVAKGNADYCFFGASALRTINLLRVEETATLYGTFSGATALTNLNMVGTVGNDIDLSDCPLTKASIESVFSVLSDTASGKTASFNSTAVNSAFTEEEWQNLTATKPNWTISFSKLAIPEIDFDSLIGGAQYVESMAQSINNHFNYILEG